MEWPGPRSGTNWGGPLPAHAGEHVATTEVRKWHIADVTDGGKGVRCWRQSGHHRSITSGLRIRSRPAHSGDRRVALVNHLAPVTTTTLEHGLHSVSLYQYCIRIILSTRLSLTYPYL